MLLDFYMRGKRLSSAIRPRLRRNGVIFRREWQIHGYHHILSGAESLDEEVTKLASNSKEGQARAEASFKNKEQQQRENAKAMAEYQAAGRAEREKTVRLKLLREARDAADAAAKNKESALAKNTQPVPAKNKEPALAKAKRPVLDKERPVS
jgi:hypothetical protein